MSVFEYLAIAYSLIFSFSAIRLVSGLPEALDPNRRYGVHLLHILLILFLTTGIFWSFLSFRDLEWNFVRFLSVLTALGLIYYLACTLVPGVPSSVSSWRSYFYQVRRRYFLGFGAWIIVSITNTTVLLELPLGHPVRGLQAFVLAFVIVGTITANPLVHSVIVIGGWVAMVILGFLLFLPGSLAT